MSKPLASLSLDLDNKWSYMKTHGDPGWESFPSYLESVVPRILAVLDELDLKITFFVVGQDALREENRAALAAIAAAGHEIGNHSFHHEPWLHEYDRTRLAAEISAAESVLEEVLGQRPAGFRGPGYSLSESVLEVLCERGYQYDASTLPTFIGPLARTFYFVNSRLNRAEREQRKRLFGAWREGFRPLRPYAWPVGGGALLEIPVTTMPLFRLPFHISYVVYLATYSTMLARSYFETALQLCRLTATQPSLLLHPLDFLGVEDEPDLGFFPGMSWKRTEKLAFVKRLLARYAQVFDVVQMQTHAAAARRTLGREDIEQLADDSAASRRIG